MGWRRSVKVNEEPESASAPDAAQVARDAPAAPHGSGDRWGTAILLTVSAVALGHALQVSNGNLDPEALFWLSVAFAACALGLVMPRLRGLEKVGESAVLLLLAAGFLQQASELFRNHPGMYLRVPGAWGYAPLYTAVVASALVVGTGMRSGTRLAQLRAPLLLAIFFSAGVWMLRASPRPFIDVFVFQQHASRALLSGLNPYAITFPDIYGSSPFYGAGVSVDGQLRFGFPYPPLSLLMALPGFLLQGDYRYAQLTALTLAGALMAYARPGGRTGLLAAALFLFSPRMFFVLEQGWTEPFAVLLLALVVFCARRFPSAVPWVLGLMLAVKQYFILTVPLVLLVLPRPWSLRTLVGWGWRAAAVALLVSAPLALWDPGAFWWSVVKLQLHQPFRADALSYLAWYARVTGTQLSPSLAFLAVVPLTVLGLWRAPRTPSGYAAAVALVLFGFFAFNKQAFCNYYFMVLGALCVSVAAVEGGPRAREAAPEPG